MKFTTEAATANEVTRGRESLRIFGSNGCADPCRDDGRHRENSEYQHAEGEEVTRTLGEEHPQELTEERSDSPSPRSLRTDEAEYGRESANHNNAERKMPG